jgi:hypothetical protein
MPSVSSDLHRGGQRRLTRRLAVWSRGIEWRPYFRRLCALVKSESTNTLAALSGRVRAT